MKFEVLTLFPEMFEPVKQSILGRAEENKLIEANLINIRDFSENKHKKVDDTPYGGGAGMVMQADVIYNAYKSIKKTIAKVIYMSPQGQVLNQKKVEGYLIEQDQVETLKYHLKHVQNLLYIEHHNDIFQNVFVSLLR